MKKLLSFLLVFVFAFSLVACGEISDDYTSSTTDKGAETSETDTPLTNTTEQPETSEPAVELTMVDAFIEEYNKVATTPITNVVEFNVTDKESGHYRTEYRLGAFSDAIAKSGKIDDLVIDIVNCGWSKDELRIYVDGINTEQAKYIIKVASPILDKTITDADIQEVLDYIDEYGDANKYYGELGVLFNNIRGELMIKTD